MKIIPSIIDYISLVVIETDRNMNYSTKHLTIPVLKIWAGGQEIGGRSFLSLYSVANTNVDFDKNMLLLKNL